MNTFDPPLRSFPSLTTTLALTTLVTALLAACGSRPIGGPDGDGEPPRGGSTAPLDVCAPAPVVAVAARIALPLGLATASCRLTHSENDANGDGRSEHGTTYEVDGRVIRARHLTSGATGPGTLLAEYELDAAGRLSAYRDFRGRAEPTTSYEWLHDDAGRLLVERTRSRSYSYYGGGTSVRATVVRQVFDGARLVSRAYEHDDVLQATFSFAYDDAGRLVRAERHDGAAPARPTARATWSYDDAGRPRSLVREEDEQIVVLASWTFDARGVLRSRSMTLPRGATSTHELDVYDTWAAQNPSIADAAAGSSDSKNGECRPLPTELTFGYPWREDDSYVLAFAGAGAEGDEMLAPYVYSSAAAYSYYSYSPARAFGHDGAVAEYDVHPSYRYGRVDAPIRVDSEYDEAGRMTSERGEAATRWERHRVFATNGLAYDVLVRSSEGNESETRALLFSRDAGGRLTSRELVAAGGIAATQRWSYDDATHTVVNTIHTESSTTPRPVEAVDARIVRGFDARGRAIRDEVTLDRVATAEPRYGEPPSGKVFQRERSYDAAGRIAVETTTQYGSWQRTENRFDDAGRELFTQSTYGEIGAASRGTSSLATTYNAAGLPTRRETTSTGSYANRLAVETMRYACDGW